METQKKVLSIDEIKKLLPHRYPFLLVDRIIDFEAGVGITGLKNVTINEPFFQGHFPDEPIMPGVLILEAMAQTGIIFAKMTAPEELSDKLLVFAGMDGVRFRRPVLPGDQLIMKLELIKRKSSLWKIRAKGFVGDDLVVEAVLMAAVQKENK